MKKFLLKAAGTMAMLALISSSSIAQDDKKETTTIKKSEDVIVITPKADADTKLTIEIKGDDIKINGKPIGEYKSDDVNISMRKHLQLDIQNRRLAEMDAMGAPRSRFKGGTTVYGYGNSDMAQLSGMNSNKAFLGVGTEKTAEGARITSISDKSAAEKAGLKEGDVITKINETIIGSPDELTKTIGKFNPAEKINLTYKRDKKEQKTVATLEKRKVTGAISYAPSDYNFKKFNLDNNYNFNWNSKPKLGLKAQETEEGKGLTVLDVDDESAAEKAGIKEGDIITSFDGTDVNDIDKLRELSKAAMEKGSFKVKFIRDGKSQEVSIKIPKNLKTTSL
ncbi:MAG: PDZ domain-containing protein [Chitinophagaceae bacterium]